MMKNTYIFNILRTRGFLVFLLVLVGCQGSIDVQIKPNTVFTGSLTGPGFAVSNLKVNGDSSLSLGDPGVTKESSLTTITDLNTTGLEGYWKLNGTVNSLLPNSMTVLDFSGNGNDGTTLDADGTMTYRSSMAFQGVEFDGVDDEITIPNTASIDIDGSLLTVMGWFYMPAAIANNGADAGIICKGDSAANEQYAITTDGNNDFTFRVTTTGSGYNEIRPNGYFPGDSWVHVAGTYDGSNMKFYVNGTQAGSMAATGTIIPSALPL